ncbi:hypothetical protein KR032_007423 [Drosophila birchii]|nr:hypothetical protein KR032_007423 [Drosophila birchii]
MFPDHCDLEPFNPFNVGPANSGARSEFKIPTSVTYPPPVFVAKPEYVKAAQEQAALISGSQGTVMSTRSKHGGVAMSKAINDEMSVAKQQAAAIHETDRIDEHVKVKIKQPLAAKKMESKASIRTLLPVKTNRLVSGAKNAKKTTSGGSVSVKQRKSSKVEIASKASKISSKLDTKSLKPFEPAKMSFSSIKSNVSETSTESYSSEETLKSDKSETSTRHSVKSSKTTVKSVKSAKSAKEAASKVTVKSQASVKQVSNAPISESSLSYGKPLTEQAADLAYRLNSGNENYRRYNSVARNHSTTVPMKLSEGDRMTFWFNDAVLS